MKLGFEGEVRPVRNAYADRYASPEMRALFSDEAKIVFERQLWITIMEEQAKAGVNIPQEAIQDYIDVHSIVDLDSIRRREEVNNHDLKSRIEEFNDLAGHQYIHEGMTSRDATDNVEQYQIRCAIEIIRFRALSTLGKFAIRAAEYELMPMAGKSHNVAGQTITMGKRFANFGEELLRGYGRILDLQRSYQLRGIKGAMGTQQDMLDMLEGDVDKLDALEAAVAETLGFDQVFDNVGQVYPRSMDFDAVSTMKLVVSGPSSFATTLRLMAGAELATEGFKPGRVGSSAMPHKRNASKSERIVGMNRKLNGYVMDAASNSGEQWQEGDVSCSVGRREMIPNTFYITDGLFVTTMKILDDFGAYPAVVQNELSKYLPFLTTTKVLTEVVKREVGREDAHEIIKEHAVTVAQEMAEKGLDENDLWDRLAHDERLPITREEIDNFIGNPLELTGTARRNVGRFVTRVEALIVAEPEAAAYVPPKGV
jgi:adenylosuccinate lyase